MYSRDEDECNANEEDEEDEDEEDGDSGDDNDAGDDTGDAHPAVNYGMYPKLFRFLCAYRCNIFSRQSLILMASHRHFQSSASGTPRSYKTKNGSSYRRRFSTEKSTFKLCAQLEESPTNMQMRSSVVSRVHSPNR